jgi:NTE family protein
MAEGDKVALVLSGGGARGAYEAGALSVLLPELEARGERPTIFVGTSVGAYNATFAAAHAHRPLDEALEEAVEMWRTLHWRDVLAPLVSPRGLIRSLRYLGRLLWVKRPRIDSLLYTDPLPATLARIVSFEQLRRNVEDGTVAAAAVSTTSAHTSRTVVFHAGGPTPERDPIRGIDYVDTPLTEQHVQASGAIPGLFPAVHVPSPERARGWYFDGGTRLNTPIKPALELGADRVVVIGLASIQPGPGELASDDRPDVFEGAAQLLQALLIDRLEQDVRELAEENLPGHEGRKIPYIFVSPRERLGVGRIASRIWRERYAGLRGFVRDPDLSTLGRFTAAGNGPVHGELLSFLFFAPEFARELIAMGRADARHWLAQEHGNDGPWRTGPPPG